MSELLDPSAIHEAAHVDHNEPPTSGLAIRPTASMAGTLAVGVGGGLLFASFMGGLITRLQPLLVLLLISAFLSFALEPAVQFLARKGMRRGFGTSVVFLAAIGLLAGFFAAMAPLVASQIENLVESAPSIITGLAEQAERVPGEFGVALSAAIAEARLGITERLPDVAGAVGGGLLGFSSSLLGTVFQGLSLALITFYLVADGPRVRRALVARLEPHRQTEALEIWELAVAKTGGYVYSRLLTAIASAGFHFVVFQFIGLPYAAALGIYVGIVSSLIPVVGTYIAGAVPLLIALSNDPVDAISVLIAIIIYQQIENYLVAPRITAATMELHPAIAFIAVLGGTALLGAAGALLALPAAAIAAALLSARGERHELVAHQLLDVPETSSARAARLGRRKTDIVGVTPELVADPPGHPVRRSTDTDV